MKSALKTLFAITLISYTASCSGQQTFTVPNLNFYGDKGKFGATKVESLHPEKPGVRLPKSKWDEERIGMVCTPAANITTLQALIDKMCSQKRTMCNYAKDGVAEVQKALSSAKRATVE